MKSSLAPALSLFLALLVVAPGASAFQAAAPPAPIAAMTPESVIASLSVANGIDALPLPTVVAEGLRAEILQLYALGGAVPTARGIAELDASLATVPASIQAPAASILAAQNEAALLRRAAFSGLDADDAAALDALADPAAVALALSKVDLAKMHVAGRLVSAAIDANLPALRENAAALPADFADPLGVVMIATVADHAHSVDRTLLIDLGGNDDWSNNAGATKPDYIIDSFPGCISTGALDCTALGGSRNKDASKDLFGRSCQFYGDRAFFEAARAPDVVEDQVESQQSQPSIPEARIFAGETVPGFANGVVASGQLDDGCLPQDANDAPAWLDTFVTRGTLAQGDEHSVAVGVDVAGNDRFAPPLEFNDINDGDNAAGCDTRGLGDAGKTWARNLTAGGGFAGVGVLWDAEGSDFYGGRSIAQGSGHVAGVGILVDEGAGDDTFSAVRLSQGVGFFAGLGLVFGRGESNDRYRLENDAPFFNEFEHFIGCDVSTRDGQGRGNFNGIGALVDLAGDDEYFVQVHNETIPGAVRDDPLTTQGAAGSRLQIVGPPADQVFAGAIGVLYDASGDDSYTRAGRDDLVTDVQAKGIFVDGGSDGVALGLWLAAHGTACTAPSTEPARAACSTLAGDPRVLALRPCTPDEPRNQDGLPNWVAWFVLRSVDDRQTYPAEKSLLQDQPTISNLGLGWPVPSTAIPVPAGPRACHAWGDDVSGTLS